ncbi:4-diphosphocytidyl-2-C-methyl-D-erythritol kinase [hydrothermal vent metagenome]|uniref:4-(cytidine 5'-diphospho)-2-C-methyl-D-erythritol kinase n=1 Tax=hydrothermal vent metagenome TaxID=652676 RepID=A0A3B1DNW0_9ZZZZ
MLSQKRTGSLVIQAPAKLNLFLEILGQRDDGFHELETLMVSVSLYDTLIFQKEIKKKIHLHCNDASQNLNKERSSIETIPNDEKNLIVQAARLLQEETGVLEGVCITLQKRIPAAAGLAGGSSDAAATLVGLNRFWKLGLEKKELWRLASKLGSDVPFFLASSPVAVCRGRGELIEPITFSGQGHFVIARPQSGLSTAEVFRHYRQNQDKKSQPRSVEPLLSSLKKGTFSNTGQHFYNALQTPARSLNSEVKQLGNILEKQPIEGHLMSGSGSACFGLCSSHRQANKIAHALRSQGIPQTFVVSISI